MHIRSLAILASLGLVACAGVDDEKVVTTQDSQGVIEFDSLTPHLVAGQFDLHGQKLAFRSTVIGKVPEVVLELRGMALTLTVDPITGAFDVDGFETAKGEDTAMTEPDRVLVHGFEVVMSDLYRDRAQELPALDILNKAVALWGEYPDEVALQRTYYGRFEKDAPGGIGLCGRVNRPGSWGWWTGGTHDCLTIKNWWSNCASITAGCENWDDGSTVNYVFMSMHPVGSCSDSTFFGSNAGNFRCYEPDHDDNIEYSYGACMGRCGGTCGGGTQFTQACLDHDVCVSFGHWNGNPECADDFVGASWDYLWASNCGGNFYIPYNWAGSYYEGNCPSAWNNTNDGCDVACQFVDADCAR